MKAMKFKNHHPIAFREEYWGDFSPSHLDKPSTTEKIKRKSLSENYTQVENTESEIQRIYKDLYKGRPIGAYRYSEVEQTIAEKLQKEKEYKKQAEAKLKEEAKRELFEKRSKEAEFIEKVMSEKRNILNEAKQKKIDRQKNEQFLREIFLKDLDGTMEQVFDKIADLKII